MARIPDDTNTTNGAAGAALLAGFAVMVIATELSSYPVALAVFAGGLVLMLVGVWRL